jgi:hypothetical protein
MFDREGLDRVNGHCAEDHVYTREDGSKWEDSATCPCGCGETTKHAGQAHSIVLFGKRTAIHPAYTRYLVAHEYGHAAASRVRRALGWAAHDDSKYEAAYMKLRGSSESDVRYGGKRWHMHPAEVMANDFRILVMQREAEFWPHEIPPPAPDSAVAAWWAKARELVTSQSG